MPWNPHPTISTGSTFTASDWNTYVKGNLDVLFPYTASLQVSYSTSTSTIAPVTSAALTVLRSNSGNTALEFGKLPVVYRRQGYFSSVTWADVSTSTSSTLSDFTPENTVIQTGTGNLATRVTFPVAFSKAPIVFGIWTNDEVNYISDASGGNQITTTQFIAFNSTGSTSAFHWIAIGEI